MAPISNINSKTYRFSKKVEEVKEVIQNKPDTDIIKVLEYFDNDVGKTIDAFINDDAKEALSKWQARIKSVNNKSNKNSQDTDDQPANNKSQKDENLNQESNDKQNKSKSNNKKNNKKTNNKASTNNDQNQNASLSSLSNRRSNLNDLVASVINQYTSSTPSTPLSSSMNSNIISNINQQQQQQANSLSEQLNRLVLNQNNQSLSSSIKVTVLGVQTSSDLLSNTCSSMSSSPLSSSTSTSDKHSAQQQQQQEIQQPKLNGHANANNTNNRPMLLDLKQNGTNTTSILNKVNMSYVNPNAKELLEKHQKDLQRQTNQLAKIASQFQEEFSKSQKQINETFDKLRELLNVQQSELQSQLIANAQNGYNILQRRQNKAVELKLLLENAQHLNEHQTQELKADIKHFVSERQLDEEFAKIRLVEFTDLEKFKQDLKQIGQIIPVHNQYATVRPAELTSPTATATITKSSEQINGKHTSNQASKSNGKSNKSTNKLNGDLVTVDNNNNSKHMNNTNGSAKLNGLNKNQEDDNEGEFIEVKKPQRNRNKKPQQQQQQPQEPLKNDVQPRVQSSNQKRVLNGLP